MYDEYMAFVANADAATVEFAKRALHEWHDVADACRECESRVSAIGAPRLRAAIVAFRSITEFLTPSPRTYADACAALCAGTANAANAASGAFAAFAALAPVEPLMQFVVEREYERRVATLRDAIPRLDTTFSSAGYQCSFADQLSEMYTIVYWLWRRVRDARDTPVVVVVTTTTDKTPEATTGSVTAPAAPTSDVSTTQLAEPFGCARAVQAPDAQAPDAQAPDAPATPVSEAALREIVARVIAEMRPKA